MATQRQDVLVVFEAGYLESASDNIHDLSRAEFT
jgi:hypothetical protein